MTKILINCVDLDIGDILFASSVAKKIKEESPWETSCQLEFSVNYLQPLELLNNNPYIDKVYYKECGDEYTEVFDINKSSHELNLSTSVVSQYQQMCNIKNFNDTFEIFTNPISDYSIECSMKELVEIEYWNSDIIKVCYVMDWDRKSYSLHNSVDRPITRNAHSIIEPLKGNEQIMLFAIGIESKDSKKFPSINSASKFSFTASLIKNSDYVIGPEGCLTNLSSAIGTSTIITTDYIQGVYGPNGTKVDINKTYVEPFLGPRKYFPSGNHTHLDPTLTDQEVGNEIFKIVSHGR
jgi:hypothetical protein